MPRPVLITCDRVGKAFGAAPLFEGLSFAVHEGDHVGVVGPNGAGKSTLLEIVAGRLEPDSGTRTIRRDTRIGFVPQDPSFEPERTVEQLVAECVPQGLVEHEHAAAVDRAISLGAFPDGRAVAGRLSGGWRKRLAIVRAWVNAPEVLLLDEPTNHLDVDGILWLERLLNRHPGAFVTVSHDRYFLQNVTNRMLEIDRIYPDGLLAVDGAYTDFLERRAEVSSQQEAYQATLANRARRELEWLRRGPKARTTKAKSRVEAAGALVDALQQSRERSAKGTMNVDFSSTERKTKRLWWAEHVCKRRGERSVIEDLNLELGRGTRLGVVGANGSGKTTLLRLIVGELTPDAGTVESADGLKTVYFDQARETLDPHLSLRQALAPEGDSVIYRGRSLHVASWARRFLFRSEQLETPVSRLSGGERARILLARLMRQPADLLVLDEPTNDLDIPTLDVLEESLLEFGGALVLVTHDRYLLDRVCTQVLGLNGSGSAQLYADLEQWLSARSTVDEAPGEHETQPAKTKKSKGGREKRKKLSYLEQREWDGMEARVLEAEAALERAKEGTEDPAIASDGATLQERYEALNRAQQEVDRLYERWAELEAKQAAETP